jgi:hypothetical protein
MVVCYKPCMSGTRRMYINGEAPFHDKAVNENHFIKLNRNK